LRGSLDHNSDLSDRRTRNATHWSMDYGRIAVTEVDIEPGDRKTAECVRAPGGNVVEIVQIAQ